MQLDYQSRITYIEKIALPRQPNLLEVAGDMLKQAGDVIRDGKGGRHQHQECGTQNKVGNEFHGSSRKRRRPAHAA